MAGVPVTHADPRQGLFEGRPITPLLDNANNGVLFDKDWVKTAFMVPDEDIHDLDDLKNRYYSSASAKFTDTRLGCNIGINPRPQWTRYADIRDPGRLSTRNRTSTSSALGDLGMGRAYSEAIDDNAQIIFMRFGVPKFNSLMDFLFRAYSLEMTVLARTGRAPSKLFDAAKVITRVGAIASFPMLGMTIEVGRAIGWLFGSPSSKFFTLKPTMHYYWNTVNYMVQTHCVNMGIFPKVFEDGKYNQRLGRPYKLDEDRYDALSNLLPDVFGKYGYLDIKAMANKAQRLANGVFEQEYEKVREGDEASFYGLLKKNGNGKVPHHDAFVSRSDGEGPTLAAYFNHLLSIGTYWKKTDETKDGETSHVIEIDPRSNPSDASKPNLGGGSYGEELAKALDAEWRDGASFAAFRVDYTGPVSEAFGNTTGESQLAQKLNSESSKWREFRFGIGDGNILGLLNSEAIKGIVNGIQDVTWGALDGVTFGFAGLVAGLGGSGYVDIPSHWQSSSATLPTGQYTMQLISPYGDPISQLINIWIPFFMLLAGGLPRSTGMQSYTSPYYCQLYDRGRVQSRLAMIESISVQRGTSNLGFSLDSRAMALDVSFTVKDLSSIMHMPMGTGSLGEHDVGIDDDNLAADYFASLAGMDLYSQIYAWPKAQVRLTNKILKIKHMLTSPYVHAAVFKNSVDNGFINAVTLGTSGLVSKIIEGAVRGTAHGVAIEDH